MLRSVITGTGSFIPVQMRANESFNQNHFYDENGRPVPGSPQAIIEKFRKITGITERRYASDEQNASDIAAIAGKEALDDSGIDPETLDQIIVSHNFGDVSHRSKQSQNVPSLANKVKNLLGIRRPECIGYDILFGCPGWVQSLIQSEAYFKAGMAKKVLLVGTETLSRVLDDADRDSMIFADGAGACVLEYKETGTSGAGILGSCAHSHSIEEACYINMGQSYSPSGDETLYIKMKGRKVYEYALTYVPMAMKKCIDDCGVDIRDIQKIFIHQANEKMDEEILKRLYELYQLEAPPGVMPMSIQWLGNSSVATVPTLYDLVRKNKTPGQELHEGNIILFASVGAGMNINAVCYRV
jgi:3-oxoacyl-[acyl-carrier-protein] synthase-3